MNLRTNGEDAGAIFSDCDRYRYLLWRSWRSLVGENHGTALFCMLNPSTADHMKLDPTLTRCRSFAERMGFTRMEVVNIFALRSTNPHGLLEVADPVGPDNDQTILERARKADIVIVGWGAFPTGRNAWPVIANRTKRVIDLLGNVPLFSFGTTSQGAPRHPLYLPKNAGISRWLPM